MINVERYRGDTVPDQFTITDSAGSPINLTGATVVMTVSRQLDPADDTAQLFQITGVSSAPASGVVTFTPSTMQANQTPGKYYFDLQMTDSGGAIQTLVKGTYTFKQDITKT